MLEFISLSTLKDFLDVLSKTKELIGQRKSKKLRLFEDVVDPIFRALQPVVEDYITLFATTLRDVSAARTTSEFNIALDNLRFARAKLFSTRAEIRALTAETMSLSHDRDLYRFLRCVDSIFYNVRMAPQQSKMSRSLEVQGLLELLAEDDDNISREFAETCIRKTLREVENGFIDAAQAHARIRIESQIHLIATFKTTSDAQ